MGRIQNTIAIPIYRVLPYPVIHYEVHSDTINFCPAQQPRIGTCGYNTGIAGRNMAVWLAFVFSFVYCVVSQAPGDGDSLCTDEFINGMPNPFYDNRPTYANNIRPLMDSRNYAVLLQGNSAQ